MLTKLMKMTTPTPPPTTPPPPPPHSYFYSHRALASPAILQIAFKCVGRFGHLSIVSLLKIPLDAHFALRTSHGFVILFLNDLRRIIGGINPNAANLSF
jgi:hypothetical protein